METVISIVRTPVVSLTLMIIMVATIKIWLNHVEISSLGDKRSLTYRQNRVVCIALCAIGYLWLLYLSLWPAITGNLWPFITEHDWAFNLTLTIFILAGVFSSLALEDCSSGLAMLMMAITWILPIIAVFLHYENDGIHFVFTTFAVVALFFFEVAIICGCDPQQENTE